jgi:hypothetical protein
MNKLLLYAVVFMWLGIPTRADDNIHYVAGSSRKICQLTGEVDREARKPTVNQTMKQFGLEGAELGYSFEHSGKLFFLFSNARPTPTFSGKPNSQNDPPRSPDQTDAIAFGSDTNIENCVHLDFVRDAIGAFKNPVVLNAQGQAAITLRLDEMPISGISQGGRMYVLFATDNPLDAPSGEGTHEQLPTYLFVERGPTRSVMAESDDNANTFHYLYDFSKGVNAKFIYSSIAQGPDGYIYFWGTQGGLFYRKSAPYFARMPANELGSRDSLKSLQYFTGLGPDKTPRFSRAEADASALFEDYKEGSSEPNNCMANLSVEWNRFVHRWVMLYSCAILSRGHPPGIWMRLAEQPWGPWSPPETIFNGKRDDGLCHFIHREVNAENPKPCDDLSIPGRLEQPGGYYAPYLISRFTAGDEVQGVSTFYYTMSTFNPNTQVIMKSTIQADHSDSGRRIVRHARPHRPNP